MRFSVSTKPRIGISACLLGQAVRFDGSHKRDILICDTLARRFELIPVCPEADAGLGVPRPPVQLVGDPAHPRALGVDDAGLDVTAALEDFSHHWAQSLNGISGVILKSRSPSCGIRDTPVFNAAGQQIAKGPGIFARLLMQRHPLLPLENEEGIGDSARRDHFINAVIVYSDWQRLSPKREHLSVFHHKHQRIMASLPAADLQQLESLLAKPVDTEFAPLAENYFHILMQALSSHK